MRISKYLTKVGFIRLVATIAATGAFVTGAVQASEGIPARREVAWLNQLADQGDAGAELQLGLAYREGRYGLQPNPRKGLRWLTAAARSRNAYAADAVANAYATGEGVTRDPNKALYWWQKAAAEGNADAQAHLGEVLFVRGQHGKGLNWLRDAADRGDARARKDLAELYRKTPLPDSDLHRGENQVAALGARLDSPGLNTLFAVWHEIEASSPSMYSAEALVDRARHGDPEAQYQLGLRYRDGSWAVKRDPKKARIWLQRAAAAGNRLAAKTLAEIRHTVATGPPVGGAHR
jgi:TPR repeat protein